VLPLEPESGEVRREADGWAHGQCEGRWWFYSDSNHVQMNLYNFKIDSFQKGSFQTHNFLNKICF
jgi:hypothetical protein